MIIGVELDLSPYPFYMFAFILHRVFCLPYKGVSPTSRKYKQSFISKALNAV